MERRNEAKRVRFKEVYCEGFSYFTFVWCETPTSHNILYAFDEQPESHERLYQIALEEELVTEKCKPRGGGVYDAKKGEYLRGSIYYGEADAKIIEIIDRRLPALGNCD